MSNHKNFKLKTLNLKLISCLVLVAVAQAIPAIFVLGGCERVPILRSLGKMGSQQQREKDMDALSIAQEAEVISIPSNEAQQAIKATGGMNTWKKTTQLQLDCVVTFYQPDGSFYLTEQSYEIHPWLNSIQISDDEPQGMFVWQWSEGKFDVLKGTGQMSALSKAVPSRCFAEAILDITTAPVRFLDGSVQTF